MAMSADDWQDLASVYRAGAERARGWAYNDDAQRDAQVLDAQADRCEEIARERDGNLPVVHDHDHLHTAPDGQRLRHRHEHSHGRGRADHDPHPVGHRHARDPFAPPEPLFPRTRWS
jgi:hypothetical protein